ncbi:hypothetical protein EPO05_02185 [Patescibacteria group bacterium]|nr:MAG: hypothetical protein EPO05_02185 [Patescibacteria group bacterium]
MLREGRLLILGENEVKKSEQEKVEKHIAMSFERGMDAEERIGYHGTSLESLQYLLKFGHLPGAAEADSTLGYQRGDLFFFPRKDKFFNQHADDAYMEEKEAIEETEVYAGILARAHFIIVSLGLDLNNPENQQVGRALSMGLDNEAEELIDQLSAKLKKSRRSIEKIISDSKKRKGVVVAIADKAIYDFSVGSGDDGEQDLYLRCPVGLSYKYIAGIKPIGQGERYFFEKIQQKQGDIAKAS